MNIKKLLKRPELVYVIASLSASVVNLVFNAFLGRVLSFEDFGILTLFNSFGYFIGIFVNGVTATINHRVAYLSGNINTEASLSFYQATIRKMISATVIVTILWVLVTPFLTVYFHIDSLLPILAFTPVLMFGIIYAAQKGLLQGLFYFHRSGLILLSESFSKLLFAVALVVVGLDDFVYLTIPGSIMAGCAMSFLLSMSFLWKKGDDRHYSFGKKFYTASLLSGFSTTAFLTFDLILIKHFLSPYEAGEYALLSLVGKMIYFIGSIPNSFMISYVSNAEGKGRNTLTIFYKLYTLVSGVVVISYFLLGPLGQYTVPILFGQKSLAIFPYLTLYCFAIGVFTLANTIITYHLSRRQYFFSGVAIIASIILSVAISIWHKDIQEVVHVVASVSLLYLFCVVIFHFLQRNENFILRNLIDIYSAFRPLEKIKIAEGKKKILIFNWRDTKHVFAGGAEVYIHELAKRWAGKGHRVTLFCGNDGRSLRYEIVDGVEVYRRGGFYFVYLWAFLYYFTQFRGRYDVIIDSQNGIPFFTPLFVQEKVYCLMHHVHQEVFRKSLRFPLREIASTLENAFMPRVYRHTRFITVSQSTKEDMILMGLTGAGIDILPPGIDFTKYKPGQKSENPLIVYVGRLKHYKRVNIFIRMAREIHAGMPNVQFVIAGDGEKRKELEDLARKIGISHKIAFLGKVSEKEKIELYQKAWVFVNPSMMEGFGITSIEANACGTPVIASDVPGLRDSVKNLLTGYLIATNDIGDYVDRVFLLIKDKKKLSELQEKCLEWAQNFNIDRLPSVFFEKLFK